MRFAPEGRPFMLAVWIVAAVLAGLKYWPALALWAPVAVWVSLFFRDPARHGPADPLAITAPADGRIVSIVPMEEQTFLHGQATRIAIFMNVFNVHVNRYPTDGVVSHRAYHRGRFVHAASEKASTDNEQSTLGLEVGGGRGRVLVRQIAGLVARRIVTDHDEGATVARGERMGLIRFGSRVDLFLPPNAAVRAQVGDRTKAGETVIGVWTA